MISGDFGRSAPPSWLASAKPLRLASSALALLPRDRSCRRRSHDAGPVAGGPSTQQPTSPTTRRLSICAGSDTHYVHGVYLYIKAVPSPTLQPSSCGVCARLPAASPTFAARERVHPRHPRTTARGSAGRGPRRVGGRRVPRGRERSERGLRGAPRAPWPVRVSALASRGVSLARFGHRTRLTLSGVGPLRGLALPGPAPGGLGGGLSGFVSEISPFHFHM